MTNDRIQLNKVSDTDTALILIDWNFNDPDEYVKRIFI